MTTYIYKDGVIAGDVCTIVDGSVTMSAVRDVRGTSKFHFYRNEKGEAIIAIGTIGKKPSQEALEAHRTLLLDKERIIEAADDKDSTVSPHGDMPERYMLHPSFVLAYHDRVFYLETSDKEKRKYFVFEFLRPSAVGSGGRMAQSILDVSPSASIEEVYRRLTTHDALTSPFSYCFKISDLKEF